MTEYSEPRSDVRVQKKNLIHQEILTTKSPSNRVKDVFSGGKASTSMADQENMAQDSAERAFFELQDAKVNFF